MTISEVISYLEDPLSVEAEPAEIIKIYDEAIKTATNILTKAIPLPAFKDGGLLFCPKCYSVFANTKYKYCPYCGQAIITKGDNKI